MATIDDYVARIEGTCGAEKDVIVIFKYEKKDEAIANILKKATLKNTIAGIIFELTFQDMLLFGSIRAAKQFLEASKTSKN